MKITTYDPRKLQNVMVGMYESHTFYKKVNLSHFMKVEQGYGIQEDVIQRLEQLGCNRVIIDTGGRIYDLPFSDYMRNQPKNYGNGLQRFCAVKRESKAVENQLTLI